MQVRAIFCLGFLTAATLLAAQQQPQTITQSDGNKLTYSVEGVSFTDPDGKAEIIPAKWLYQNCPDLSKSGLTDPDSYLKEVCAIWTKYNDQPQPQPENQAQQDQSIGNPPATIPDNCSIMNVLAVSQNGKSDAYNLLGYEIAALSVGHEAEVNNAAGLKSMRSTSAAKDPAGMLADVFQNLNLAADEYHCGAFIVGQYQAKGDNLEIDRWTTISVYNRLAVINAKMKDYVEDRFRNLGSQSASDIVDRANTLAKLTNDRKAAFSDLVSAIAMSGLLSIYAGDPNAKVADTLNMSAAERQRLLTQVNEILKPGGVPDDFTKNADFLKTFLEKHPKVLN
jgi:hypothetical protein